MPLHARGGTLIAAGTPNRRGVTGTRVPPFTPAYDTPATATASSFAALLTALHACTGVGPEVIEYVGPDLTGVLRLLPPGATEATPVAVSSALSWEGNVLIRPPLGERRSFERLSVECQHVTVAGFDVIEYARFNNAQITGHTSAYRYGERSFFWRCVGIGATTYWNNTGSPKAGLVECVQAVRAVNEETFGNNSDRMRWSSGNGAHSDGMSIVGCHMRGITAALAGNRLIDVTMQGPHQVGDVLASAVVPSGGYSSTAAFYHLPEYDMNSTDDLTVELRVNGVAVETPLVPPSNTSREPATKTTTGRVWTEGQVITVVLTAIDASLVNQPIYVGVGIDRYDDQNHADTLQLIRYGDSSWYCRDFKLIDTILEGSSNATCQLVAGAGGNQYSGDLLLDNSLFLRGPGSGHNINMAQVAGVPAYEHVVDCDIVGGLTLQDSDPLVFERNRLTESPFGFTPPESNAIGGDPTPRGWPELPDLAALWPECPWSPS